MSPSKPVDKITSMISNMHGKHYGITGAPKDLQCDPKYIYIYIYIYIYLICVIYEFRTQTVTCKRQDIYDKDAHFPICCFHVTFRTLSGGVIFSWSYMTGDVQRTCDTDILNPEGSPEVAEPSDVCLMKYRLYIYMTYVPEHRYLCRHRFIHSIRIESIGYINIIYAHI